MKNLKDKIISCRIFIWQKRGPAVQGEGFIGFLKIRNISDY